MMIRGIDYTVQLISFPNKKIKETVTPNEDGSFTIFIESSLSRIEQQKSFVHAIKHILGDDFEKLDVQKIEYEAHMMNWKIEYIVLCKSYASVYN